MISGFAAARSVRSVRSARVTVDGVDVLAMSPSRRARWGVRRTFQTELLAEDLSVADNVRVAAENTRAAAGATDAVLDLVGLADRAHEPARYLDSFERRLLEIARAAVGAPRLLLCDEPGGGLAPDESTRLRDLLLALPDATGARVAVVDHDVDLIAATCTVTACLDFGRPIAAGPTRSVLDDPLVRSAYLGVDDQVVSP